MINFQASKMFFDRQPVIKRVDKAKRNVLSKFGAHTRQTAKRSIRTRRKPSPPGKPPTNRTGTLKRFIFFGYDVTRESVLIGPALLSGKKGDAPSVLEYGGTIKPHPNPRRVRRRVGGSGVIVRGRTASKSSKQVKDQNQRLVWVTFGRLKTADQVARSERLEAEIWGPLNLGGSVKPRPYMGPAFEQELTKLPPNWRNSVSQ